MKNNQDTQIKRAVIYCRVSTKEQVEEGNSLVSQERLCKEYAIQNQYIVERIFIEQGESAKTIDRSELQKLLSFCSDKKSRINAVITYKIDRISRNMDGYSEIRILLKRYGVEIKSTSENFENTPAGRFMENIIANVAQFDNDVRTERAIGGMREAVLEGRFIWPAPFGYSNIKVNGKASIKKSAKASVVLETFQRIASSQNSSEEVRLLMNKRGLVKSNGKPFCKSYFYKILRNTLYTGKIVKFGLVIKGSFDPIIDQQLFDLVQKVLAKRKKSIKFYNVNNPDFSLRKFVIHPSGEPIIGAWCKGRSKKYPFYWFRKEKKYFRSEILENSFFEYLNNCQLNENDIRFLKYFVAINVLIKDKSIIEEKSQYTKLIVELKESKRKLYLKNIEGVINDSDLKDLIAHIDNKIFELETTSFNTKITNEDKFISSLKSIKQYQTAPGSVWKESPFKIRTKLQWFNFPEGITFDGKKFRTTKTSSIYKTKTLFLSSMSTKVPFSLAMLNQQEYVEKSQKWLNSLPNPLFRDEVFWRQVYDDVIRLGEIFKERADNQDSDPY